MVFNGTQGRIERSMVESVYVNGTETVQGGIADGGVTIRVIPRRGEARTIVPWSAAGYHGGGDRLMLDDIFLPNPAVDKYIRAADERAGRAPLPWASRRTAACKPARA